MGSALQGVVYPSNPESDWHLISPYNFTAESHIKVMRIKEMIPKRGLMKEAFDW